MPAGFVPPLVITVMGDIGIEISEYRSKHLNELLERQVDTADQAGAIFSRLGEPMPQGPR